MIIKTLGAGLITIPLVSFLQHISMVKLFARKVKYKMDPTQEFIALGLVNDAVFWRTENSVFAEKKNLLGG